MANKVKLSLLFILLIPCWVIASHYEIDLVNIYSTAQFLWTDISRVYAQNGNLGRYFYGPFSLILVKPMGLVSFVWVKWIWILLQTYSFYVFWKYLYQLYPYLLDPKIFWGWLLVFIVSINPIHNNYQSNNIQLMLAAILITAEVYSRSQSNTRQFLAGVFATIAAAIKIFPLFIVGYYFLAKSSWVRKGVLMGSAFVLVAPLLFFGRTEGMQLYRDFLLNLTSYGQDNSLTAVGDILCLPSLLARLGINDLVSKLFLACVALGFFAWVIKFRKEIENPEMEIHLAAMAWALCALLNPSTRPHYFIFYLPGLCSLLQLSYKLKTKNAFYVAAGIVSTLLIAFTPEGVVGKRLNDTFEMLSIPTYGMLLLCVALVFAIQNQRFRVQN